MANKIITYRKKRFRFPVLFVSVELGCYCWVCENKDLKVSGNSKQEAIIAMCLAIDSEYYGNSIPEKVRKV